MARKLLTPPNDKWAALPAHEYADGSTKCLHCGDVPIWASYEAYVEHFWANEYEGEPGHAPDEREVFEYLAATCLNTDGVES